MYSNTRTCIIQFYIHTNICMHACKHEQTENIQSCLYTYMHVYMCNTRLCILLTNICICTCNMLSARTCKIVCTYKHVYTQNVCSSTDAHTCRCTHIVSHIVYRILILFHRYCSASIFCFTALLILSVIFLLVCLVIRLC